MTKADTLAVGGLAPFTTIDFPGRLAAVVFCRGCPWRCSYCHNTHLQSVHSPQAHSWPQLLDWFKSRRGLLDGVVFSGGEPLLQRGLSDAMVQVRELGFAVGLHTAGIYPQRLAAILPVLDWIGLDVKGPFEDYQHITGAGDGACAQTSLQLVLKAGISYEIRCTVDPNQLGPVALSRLGQQLAQEGVQRLVLQPCRRGNRALRIAPALVAAVAGQLPQVELRRA